jgi:hypothetical protein
MIPSPEPYSKGVCSHSIYAVHCPVHGTPHRPDCRCQMCGMLKAREPTQSDAATEPK